MKNDLLEIISGDQIQHGDLVFGLFPVNQDNGYKSDRLNFRVSLCFKENGLLEFFYCFSEEHLTHFSRSNGQTYDQDETKIYCKFPSNLVCKRSAHVFLEEFSGLVDDIYMSRLHMPFETLEEMIEFYQNPKIRNVAFEIFQMSFIRINKKFIGSITQENILRQFENLFSIRTNNKKISKFFRSRIANFWLLYEESLAHFRKANTATRKKTNHENKKKVILEISETLFCEYENLIKDQSLLVLTQNQEESYD